MRTDNSITKDWSSFQNSQRWISLHDCKITGIKIEANQVVFQFDDGFMLVENQNGNYVKPARIVLHGCTPDDFSCYIIKRESSQYGARLKGDPIPFEKLSTMISSEKSIEIITELYDSNFMHFRGALYPYEGDTLSTHIVIETNDFFQMTYWW